MPWSGSNAAAILHPVGPLDHHGQVDARNGDAGRVAQQRRHIDGLAGAVDAALGEHIRIEPLRHVAPGDAAVGQIEGLLLEIEKGVIAAVARGDDQRRRQSAFAARQPRREADRAVGVGLLGGEHLVVAREQPDLDAVERRGGRQRIDEGMDAVGAGIGGQPEIGDDEPLRGALADSRCRPHRRAAPRADRRRAAILAPPP